MPQFTMISQFILGLSIIVGLHELGHMLLAKLFGMRVESYTIGFPPKIIQCKWGETVYSLGAIPLGGFVKIAGMAEEALDTAHPGDKPCPWEFRAKPAWQRLLVILGGILFNVLSGILIFTAITFSLGDTYLAKDEVNKHGIVPHALGASLGFQEGDQITHINGRDFTKFADVMDPRVLLEDGGYYTVRRQGQVLHIAIPTNFLAQLADHPGQGSFIAPLAPFEVGEVQQSSPAAQAGLQPGDQIMEVADQATPYFHQLRTALAAHAGTPVSIKYVRDGIEYHITARVDETGKLGFRPKILLTEVHQQHSVLQATAIGTTRALEIVRINSLALRKVITGQVSFAKSLSGPIGIAQIFGRRFDWIHFWSVVGFLSMMLAFTNLLPIPALDGGHIVLISYEMIAGRRLPGRLLEVVQMIGITMLLLLTSYAIFNDLCKLFQ
ncbi:MAG: RIP metalloprotease RseP [Bacteroidota bacterium]